ncbi:MAG: DNA/RNA non-specific endonuclease [Butyricicoccus pullicaecorum]|nr:DNA/RNA non-specific endonuclease [Butyricicoccus pullicaecorum]
MKKRLIAVGLLLIMVLSGCAPVASDTADVVALSDVPEFSGEPYVVINDNEPSFPAEDFTSEGFEEYSPLDDLGRCGVAYANVGLETMPTEERGSISNVKPTGWKSVQYDFVDGKSLYNRCHLIGFQLTGENANRQNLITGTRYMNVDGMLPFENLVADYVKETENHVLYRVTPIFEGDNLVASGVQMEAQSVEDKGEGVCFNVYVYNNQPGVTIDYETGDSWASDEAPADTSQESTYILNTSSRKFHKPDCGSVETISPANKKSYTGTREELINQGYEACGKCKP